MGKSVVLYGSTKYIGEFLHCISLWENSKSEKKKKPQVLFVITVLHPTKLYAMNLRPPLYFSDKETHFFLNKLQV